MRLVALLLVVIAAIAWPLVLMVQQIWGEQRERRDQARRDELARDSEHEQEPGDEPNAAADRAPERDTRREQ